jgi:hypothetical protein
MQFKWVLLIIAVLSGTAQAQEPWPPERPDERQQTVMNEDGGRSFIIRPASAPLPGVMKPGGPIVGDLLQHSIFLGSGWADPGLRAREPQLGNLLANIRDQAQLDAVEEAGVKNLFGPTTSFEKLDMAGARNISDLEIQSVLAGMFKDGQLPRPSADSIYVVFLDPGLHSTLGSLVADKHYVAYHGFFNASGAKIHYAVVPFQPDTKAASQIALRALVVAALHSADGSH